MKGKVTDMKNTLTALNNYLFEALERINDDDLTDEELEKEIKKTEVKIKIASTIIENANTQLHVMKHFDEYGYNAERKVPEMLETK